MFRKLIITVVATSTIMERRVENTIERLCGQLDPHQIEATQAVMTCRQQAWANVRPQMETHLAAARATASYKVASR